VTTRLVNHISAASGPLFSRESHAQKVGRCTRGSASCRSKASTAGALGQTLAVSVRGVARGCGGGGCGPHRAALARGGKRQWRNDGVAAASSDGGQLVVGGPRQF